MPTKVILIHQDIRPEMLLGVPRDPAAHVVLVTTHEAYPSEQEEFRAILGEDLEILPMAHFSGDADAEDADRLLCKRFEESGRVFMPYEEYSQALLRERASRLAMKLESRYGKADLWHADGLGIPGDWWAARGSNAIPGTEPTRAAPPSKGIFARIRDRMRSVSTWTESILPDGRAIVLCGRMSRVRGRFPREQSFRRPSFALRLANLIPRVGWMPTRGASRRVFAAPSHEYGHVKSRTTWILQDGHFPRDYTRFGSFYFHPEDPIVPSNPFSEDWCRRVGHLHRRITGYSDPDFRTIVEPGRPERERILLILGHGGDWSTLIHRSDTDRLVLEFLALASERLDMDFRLRPHPTMRHPYHEGPNSLERVRKEVRRRNLPNLEASSGGLDEDLAWATTVVSEYSQVLVEAWTHGVLGITFNVTGRRSLLKEYEEIGFLHATTRAGLLAILDDRPAAISRQNAAVREYNAIMAQWRDAHAE